MCVKAGVTTKLQEKLEKEQTDYMSEFERHVLKRTQIEKRHKQRQEEKQLETDYLLEERKQKQQQI